MDPEVVKAIVEVVILAVLGIEIRTRRKRQPASAPQGELKPNGHPSIGELARRVEKLEDDLSEHYMRKELVERYVKEGEADRKRLGDLLAGQQRAINNLMGQA